MSLPSGSAGVTRSVMEKLPSLSWKPNSPVLKKPSGTIGSLVASEYSSRVYKLISNKISLKLRTYLCMGHWACLAQSISLVDFDVQPLMDSVNQLCC